MQLKLTPQEQAARQFIEANADMDRAAIVATEISALVVEKLNAANIPVGTHLLAQALIAHASLNTAATWWASLRPGMPLPVAFGGLLDLCLNLPVAYEGVTVDLRSGEEME